MINEKQYKKAATAALKAITAHKNIGVKLLLECWNADTPHFGGGMPHRYDGSDKECAYCLRPKTWKKINPGLAVGFIDDSEVSDD